MMIGYFDMALADQDLSKPQPKRADEFLAKYKGGEKALNTKLSELALKAAASDANFRALGLELRTQFPQIDRMCLVVRDGETMEVKRVIQEPKLSRVVGGAGIKVGAKETGLLAAMSSSSSSTCADLDAHPGIDMKLMSRAFGSSAHVPVIINDRAATINFWSTDKNAFPPEAVKLLEEMAKKMVE
jgi:hypothetical protein